MLQDSDAAVRVAAAGAVWEISRDAEAVLPVAVEALREERVEYQGTSWRAFHLLQHMGPAAAAAVPSLEEILAHGSISDSVAAAVVLGAITGDDQLALARALDRVAKLSFYSGEEDAWAVFAVPYWLKYLGAGAVPALIEMLQGGNIIAKQVAILTLNEMGPVAEDAVPALQEIIKRDDIGLADQARAALRSIQHND